MKAIFKKSIAGLKFSYHEGQTADIDDKTFKQWEKAEICEEVKETKKGSGKVDVDETDNTADKSTTDSGGNKTSSKGR